MTSDSKRVDDQRRLAIFGAAAVAATSAFPGFAAQGADGGAVPFSAGVERPRWKAPAGAIDCHIHIYDHRFPPAPNATLRPADASLDDYARLQRRLGTARMVIVQPSTYGTDNGCTLEALANAGARARAVAVVDAGVDTAELRRMDNLGVRGIRFNLVQTGATTFEMLEPLAKRVAELGWHVQLHMKAEQIAQAADTLGRLPCPIVFDHLGRVPPSAGTGHPGFVAIRRLLDAGRTWMKLSGAYHDSISGPRAYADMAEVARAYATAAPDRMVWGSDWPHPTKKDGEKPDDAWLFDLLEDWVPDADRRRQVMIDNPQALYGFGPATGN